GGEERVGSNRNLSSPSREGSLYYVTLSQLDEDNTSLPCILLVKINLSSGLEHKRCLS
ncbi:hypothetical protein HN51_007036, partial [Arachis hypogaea]